MTARRTKGSGGAPKEDEAPASGETASGAVSARAVNRGHVFALRPKVSTAFRPEDFLEARRLLEGESYETIEAAARAVAERALSLSNDPGPKRGKSRRR